jgi:hypothetical protein
VAVPLMIIMAGFLVYEYGYLKVRAELDSIHEQQDAKIALLQKYSSLIAEKPRYEKMLASLKEARKAEEGNLITAQTPSLAAATLQDMVKGIITMSAGTVSSERVGKPEAAGKFTVISVGFDAILPDAKAMSDVLYSIETRTPTLAVKELDIRVRNFRTPKELMVKMEISAMTSAK